MFSLGCDGASTLQLGTRVLAEIDTINPHMERPVTTGTGAWGEGGGADSVWKIVFGAQGGPQTPCLMVIVTRPPPPH